jgi:hypothetical protein
VRPFEAFVYDTKAWFNERNVAVEDIDQVVDERDGAGEVILHVDADREGRRLEKTRCLIPGSGDLTIELDVYAGGLSGLTVAEVEFGSEDAANAFQPPGWFGSEVTHVGRFKNQKLACHGAPGDLLSDM